MLDIDLSDPINQVRAIIGDVDGSYISDNNIQYLLTKHSNDVKKASSEALQYILNIVAYYVNEEVDEVRVDWSDIYNHLFERKKQLDKELVYATPSTLFKFGGTTKSEVKRVKNDNESAGIGIRKEDFYDTLNELGIDPNNPYILLER